MKHFLKIKDLLWKLIETKQSSIVEVEHYNASIQFINDGIHLSDVKGSIVLNYGDIRITRTVNLSRWDNGHELDVRFDFLRTSKSIDWFNSNMSVIWEGKNQQLETKTVSNLVAIKPKVNSEIQAKSEEMNLGTNDDSNVVDSALTLNTHIVDVKDKWVNSPATWDYVLKGSGPQGVAQVKFNQAVTAVDITYPFKSETHNWLASYTTHWTGSFSGYPFILLIDKFLL